VKSIRLSGLIIGVLVITGVLGVSSALAVETTLCKNSTNSPYCTSEDSYPTGSSLQASSTNATINMVGGIINCASSSLSGQTTAATGAPLPVSLSAWSLEGCKVGTTSCTVTANAGAPFPGSAAWTSGNDGELTLHSNGSAKPGWKFACGGAINCTLGFEPTLDVKGGATGQINASSEPMSKVSGILCPKTNTFSASYSVTSPKPVYVAQPVPLHTRLCKVNVEGVCPVSNSYPRETILETEAPSIEIKTSGLLNFSCGKSTIVAKTLALGAEPLPSEVLSSSFQECKASSGGSCEMKSVGAAPGMTISAPEAKVRLTDTWALSCLNGFACTYSLEEAPAGYTSLFGQISFAYEAYLLNKSGTLCPEINRLSATFTVNSPSPLYPR
jgi:hypothetical protein